MFHGEQFASLASTNSICIFAAHGSSSEPAFHVEHLSTGVDVKSFHVEQRAHVLTQSEITERPESLNGSTWNSFAP
jgi:hypothetical protein